jgi:hypothetical protein
MPYPVAKQDTVTERLQAARLKKEESDARKAKIRADVLEQKYMPVEDARSQMLAMASGVRRALDLAPSFLPSDLSPEEREACVSAMSQAHELAVQSIPKEYARE